jgi:penicillin amidase
VVDPADGLVWTANARVVEGEALAVLGDGGYDLGARSRQIRDDLRALDRADELHMLQVQLDDRALFLERWRGLALDLLSPAAVADRPLRAEARDHLRRWRGRATSDAVGYRLVRAFRLAVRDRVVGDLTAACSEADERFRPWRLGQVEDSLWGLVSERPDHLLPADAGNWEELLLACLDRSLDTLLESCGALERCTWGARNTARIRHPLSAAVPLLGRWLDMPAEPLPGDSHMPRVLAPSFGASERMVVSPGREENGIFHMPCGQSGHPLSPFYRAGHEAWVRGEPTPFLPGPAEHGLVLVGGEM